MMKGCGRGVNDEMRGAYASNDAIHVGFMVKAKDWAIGMRNRCCE